MEYKFHAVGGMLPTADGHNIVVGDDTLLDLARCGVLRIITPDDVAKSAPSGGSAEAVAYELSGMLRCKTAFDAIPTAVTAVAGVFTSVGATWVPVPGAEVTLVIGPRLRHVPGPIWGVPSIPGSAPARHVTELRSVHGNSPATALDRLKRHLTSSPGLHVIISKSGGGKTLLMGKLGLKPIRHSEPEEDAFPPSLGSLLSIIVIEAARLGTTGRRPGPGATVPVFAIDSLRALVDTGSTGDGGSAAGGIPRALPGWLTTLDILMRIFGVSLVVTMNAFTTSPQATAQVVDMFIGSLSTLIYITSMSKTASRSNWQVSLTARPDERLPLNIALGD